MARPKDKAVSYVAYRGDEIVGVFDSLDEIAKHEGVSRETARFALSTAAKKRASGNGLIVERVNESDVDETA